MALWIVWGTRIKETAIGAIAVNCRCCGELSIADCIRVGRAQHVYFIHGKFQDAGSYIKCRVCGVPQDMPSAVTPVPLGSEDETRPTPDFLRATDPRLDEVRHPPIPLAGVLPPSVSRTQWAIVQAIHTEIGRQDADDKVSGNINPLYLLTLMGFAGGFITIWLQFEHESKWIPLALLVSVAGVLLFLIRWFHIFLLHRALDREMTKYVRRNLAHTGNAMESLVAAADALGKDYRAVATFLRWADSRLR